jgi:hypothetical protein
MKTCIFCDSPAGSREHVWPEWIRKRIRQGTVRGFIGRNKDLKFDGPWQTRTVCRSCNNGWMHKLEDESIPIMEPMLLDKSRFLDAREQWVVSRWALKTAMVVDSTTVAPDRPIFYSVDQRRALKDAKEIPNRSFVWLGRDLSSGFAAASTGLSYEVAPSHDLQRIVERATGQVSTFLVGSLAIQVVTVSLPAKYSDGAIRLRPTKGPWDELLVPIWPPKRNVYWPPILAFMDAIPELRHNNILRTRWNVGAERKVL